jgi:hypothetical protein
MDSALLIISGLPMYYCIIDTEKKTEEARKDE